MHPEQFFIFIFETPYLNMSGMFSIPLSISFLPIVEFIALEPRRIPRLPILSASAWFSPCTVCILRSFLYFFFILLALPCVVVLARANPTFFLWLLLIFWAKSPSSCHALVSSFLLIISYLATKDVPLGRFTSVGTARPRRTIFSLILIF